MAAGNGIVKEKERVNSRYKNKIPISRIMTAAGKNKMPV